MRTRILILLLFTVGIIKSNAQTRADFNIKEQYDKIHSTLIDSRYDPCNISIANIPDTYGDGMSYVLESYLRMYETTKDKAYLNKFAIEAICMQENRGDTRGYSPYPIWSQDIYQDGLAIWPMTHFWYITQVEEPTLTVIPICQTGKISSNTFNQTFGTYGDFALWLRNRAERTLEYYTYAPYNHWQDNLTCYTDQVNPDGNVRAIEVNKQAAFGAALFYLGVADPNQDYLDKAVAMAQDFDGNYKQDNCPGSDDIQIRSDFLNNGSYIWHANGWREVVCSDVGIFDDYEDISHGLLTLIFPRAIYNQLESNNVVFVDDFDMIKYRNTFAYNIFAGYSNGCPDFHSGIDGDDVINYKPGFDGLNTLKIRSLGYMDFYKFDPYASGSVYDIVMNFYSCDVYNNDPEIETNGTGLDYYGLSQVVSAQWDKECVNLSIYKRDLVYDQDFNVKNNLTIEPESTSPYNTTSSFADPVINSETFTIEPGVSSTMTAGESIILKPGFTAKAGCVFTAEINPSACTDGHRMSNENNGPAAYNVPDIYATENSSSAKSISTFQNNLAIAPNPFDGTTSILFSIETKGNVTIKITNEFGQEIFSGINNIEMEKGNYTAPFDGSNLEKGVYFCVLQVNGQALKIKKMVVL